MRTWHLLLDVLDPSAGICNHVRELSEHCGQRIDVDVFGDVDLVLSGNPLVFHRWTNWKWVCVVDRSTVKTQSSERDCFLSRIICEYSYRHRMLRTLD